MLNERTFGYSSPAPHKERPFLPRMNDGGILARFCEGFRKRMSFRLALCLLYDTYLIPNKRDFHNDQCIVPSFKSTRH
jgi:hypothetical protein